MADESAGNEPIPSHGMRPGRVWADVPVSRPCHILLPCLAKIALIAQQQDDEDDEVTVSPRVMSPELDEPAGSLHVRGFHKRGNEPQERRTTFIALGNLGSALRSSSPMMVAESDESPATQRARQLVQLIQR